MTQKKNFFHNVLDAMMEARAQQAERELALYRHKFPGDQKSVL